PALFARKSRDDFAPAGEFSLQVSAAVQNSVQTFSESLRAALGLQGVANCHLFEREKQICARFNLDSLHSYLKKLSLGQLLSQKSLVAHFFSAAKLCLRLVAQTSSIQDPNPRQHRILSVRAGGVSLD